eukprot:5136442-Lingulodinium_polyedra.AAC.1
MHEYISTTRRATRTSNLEYILKLGSLLGHTSGNYGVVEVQLSPAFPVDAALPLRTRVGGRTSSPDCHLLIVLGHEAVLRDIE